MEPLPLSLVGWLHTTISAAALAIGSWLIVGIHFSGEDAKRQLATRVIEDAVLFGIWLLGFAGGVGVLLEKSWSRGMLEMFCWVLMVLVTLTAVSRYRAAPSPRATLGFSLALFVIPLLALCAATIYTLRATAAA